MNKWLFLLFFQVSLIGNGAAWEQYKKETLPSLGFIEGWCSPKIAEKMMDLIYDVHPTLCVEIGVYAGSSIFPTAKALKYQGEAKVYAIDPWETEDHILLQFKLMLHGFQLFDNCVILHMSAEQASHHFENSSIDILHINKEDALNDIITFLPKIKPGGYIWLNNAHWASIQPALQYLSEHCTLDSNRSTTTCFLYEKN